MLLGKKEELKQIPLNSNKSSLLPQTPKDNTQFGVMKNKSRIKGTCKMMIFKMYFYDTINLSYLHSRVQKRIS